ncbi:MAG TPA: glycosyltransferase family 39 protein, partial [Paracoccus sp. (in: a-proteobacteria)]|nr:glycosyltransferase family 39 protein [Paracoccus sp. (in: a-proteobacteria)]
GKARPIDPDRLAGRAASGAPAAFSLPPDKAGMAAGLGLHELGVFGRHVLFVTDDESKVK